MCNSQAREGEPNFASEIFLIACSPHTKDLLNTKDSTCLVSKSKVLDCFKK